MVTIRNIHVTYKFIYLQICQYKNNHEDFTKTLQRHYKTLQRHYNLT